METTGSGSPDDLTTLDAEVQCAIARGNFTQALERLVQAYQHRMVSFCAHALADKSRAEDLAQEVFLAAFMAMPAFDGAVPVRPWLYRIAHNRCTAARRQAVRREVLARVHQRLIAVTAHRPRGVSLEEGHAQQACIQYALRRLRIRDRELLRLCYRDGYTHEEVAAIFRVVPKTIDRWVKKVVPAFQKAYTRCMHDVPATL